MNHLVSAHMQLNRKAPTPSAHHAAGNLSSTYSRDDSKIAIKISSRSSGDCLDDDELWECSSGYAVHRCPVP